MCAPNFCACTNARPGERLTGDAGRKAEIVFDARARARLAARRAAVEHDHRESFRRRVHRRREPGRSRADDRDVVDMRGIEIWQQAEAASRAWFSRVRAAPCRPGRSRAASRPVDAEMRSSSAIASGSVARVDHGMRIAVAAQKALQRHEPPSSDCRAGRPARCPSRSATTRRRISARMMRSPSSASATSSARSRSGGITMLDRVRAPCRRQARLPDSWPTSARKCPGACSPISDFTCRCRRADRLHAPFEQHEHAGPGRPVPNSIRPLSSARSCRTGACARSPLSVSAGTSDACAWTGLEKGASATTVCGPHFVSDS